MKNISILGDSRAFDTYYTNDHYVVRYGYDFTFPHLWRRKVLEHGVTEYDVIHIPDHFRSGTIQNNIIRLALTNPSIVVILDGIWESLLNRNHFVQYVEKQTRDFPKLDAPSIELSYSQDMLVKLFKENQLTVSPEKFGRRAREIVSYFHRRRRHVVWMTLPVPPSSYIGSTYHAGNYRPFDGWNECLAALNDAVVPIVGDYGGTVLDLTNEMEAVGGASSAFIDQWHFSPAFHARLADSLNELSSRLISQMPNDAHVSNLFMLGAPEESPGENVVIYDGDPDEELEVLNELPASQILVYPDELMQIVNPPGNERAEFERQELR